METKVYTYIYILVRTSIRMKRHITLNVDSELIDEAKKKGLIISDVLNKALYDQNRPMKKDFSEDSLKLFCSVCELEVKIGYRCEFRKIAICDECHDVYDMSNCLHVNGEHIHERFGEVLEPLVNTW